MTPVLLFGASGFIGRHVHEALAPYAELRAPSRAECDLTAIGVRELTELIRAAEPAAVINCAGRLDGSGYQLIAANTVVTAKLIEAVITAAPRARLVRIGSASEYGPVPTGHAVAETDPTRPVGEYGLSHLTGTRLVEFACASGRLDAAVLRVFNPIGPGLPATNVLGRALALLRQAGTTGQERITLGSLDAYRDFVDVRDVARAVRAVVATPVLPQRVFNIGSGRAVATRHAVRLLAQAAGFGGEIGEGTVSDHSGSARRTPRRDPAQPSGGARTANIPWMCADVSRAVRVLGWTPTHDLADSVKALWAEPDDEDRRVLVAEPQI